MHRSRPSTRSLMETVGLVARSSRSCFGGEAPRRPTSRRSASFSQLTGDGTSKVSAHSGGHRPTRCRRRLDPARRRGAQPPLGSERAPRATRRSRVGGAERAETHALTSYDARYGATAELHGALPRHGGRGVARERARRAGGRSRVVAAGAGHAPGAEPRIHRAGGGGARRYSVSAEPVPNSPPDSKLNVLLAPSIRMQPV